MNNSATGWPAPPVGTSDPVPARYWGVWSRTLLQTPQTRDTTTLVRWMQLGQWHVDLRVPVAADAPLQGFSGITQITQVGAQEMCTWQRLVDYQPPRATVDEGWMVFETPEQVVETGIHGVYREVWDRLAGSTGRRIALAEPPRADGTPSARLFVSGDYLMRVRPAEPLTPAFEISFGTLVDGKFSVEASTISALTGTCKELSLSRMNATVAEVGMDSMRSAWEILEWQEA
jgi:hypothetical protein